MLAGFDVGAMLTRLFRRAAERREMDRLDRMAERRQALRSVQSRKKETGNPIAQVVKEIAQEMKRSQKDGQKVGEEATKESQAAQKGMIEEAKKAQVMV